MAVGDSVFDPTEQRYCTSLAFKEIYAGRDDEPPIFQKQHFFSARLLKFQWD